VALKWLQPASVQYVKLRLQVVAAEGPQIFNH